MSRTVLSYLPEGLARMLEGLRRDVEDLKRRPMPLMYQAEADEDEILSITGTAHLLTMAATGDSIASGGDYITFGSIIAQQGFPTVTGAGDSWQHPVSGVYALTYEHAWDTYTGGGTVALELDGTLIPEGTVMDGTAGQEGRGTILYVAEEGRVGKVKVTQSSGAAQACDALVRVGITDPKVSAPAPGAASNVVALGTQDAPGYAAWTAGGAAWVDGDAEWIWHTALTADGGRPPGEEGWFEGVVDVVSAAAVTIEFSADNSCEVWLNGASLGTNTDFTTRTTATATLAAGSNLFEIHGSNTGTTSDGNPAAVILSVRNSSTGAVIFRTNDTTGWTGYTAAPPGWSH